MIFKTYRQLDQDMMQEGYEPQWGPLGRNDLGLMKVGSLSLFQFLQCDTSTVAFEDVPLRQQQKSEHV